jgi:hypothetical protein
MNNKLIIAAVIAVTLTVGFLFGRGLAPQQEGAATAPADKEILYWVAPMDPNFRRDEPGKSPMGMDLVPVYADEAGATPGVVSIDPTVLSNLGVRTAAYRLRRGYAAAHTHPCRWLDRKARDDRDRRPGSQGTAPVRAVFADAGKCATGISRRAGEQQRRAQECIA